MPRPYGNDAKVNNSSHCITSAHETGTITFSSLMEEALSQFNVEKDAKNKAYAFILSRGLLNDFKSYCEAHHGDDHHSAAISYLYSQI